jgi:protein-tyrosine phosphatase
MDLSWITDRIAVGGGIWNAGNMAELAALGITHIINMQIEFDERSLAVPHNIEVLWNPVDDDFLPKPPDVFQRGVRFAQDALADSNARLYVHCAAGVHRGPTMALAILCAQGYDLEEAKRLIQEKRYVVDWAEVYVKSVEEFLKSYASASPSR